MKKMCVKLLIGVLLFIASSIQATPPEPELGQRWVRNDLFSDEFNGNNLNTIKWRNTFQGWQGRSPGYFDPNAVSVSGGDMIIRNHSGVPEGIGGQYTLSGGAVQSQTENSHFGYYECNFRASRINMSTTFWLSSSGQPETRTVDGNDTYSQELDICESIGGGGNFSSDFRKKMKFNTHYRLRADPWPVAETFYSKGNNQIEIRDGDLVGGDASLGTTESWEDYHTYACHWRSAQDALFFVEDRFIGKVEFRTDIVSDPFADPMRINLVTETYNWAKPYPTNAELNDNNINASYYNWVRTYVMLPIDQVTNLDDEEETIFTEGVLFKDFLAVRNPETSYSFPVLYKANKDRDIHVIIKDGAGFVIKDQLFTALQGYGHQAYNVALDASLALGNYTVEVQLTSLNGTNIINNEIKSLSIQDGDINNPNVAVDFVKAPSEFVVGNPLTFEASYTTDKEVELILLLNANNGDWLGNFKQVVQTGSGSITGTIATDAIPQIGEDYKITVLLRAVGGAWEDNIILKEILVDIVEPFECPNADIFNECFESGIYSWEGWGEATKEVQLSNVNSGVYSLKVAGLGASNYRIPNLIPNTEYELNGYVKITGSNALIMGVKEFNGTEESGETVTSTTFEKVTITFTTGATNTSAEIYLYSPNVAGEGYLDDLSLKQLTVTGLNSSFNLATVLVSPNPAQDVLQISSNGSQNNYQIFSPVGKEILIGRLENNLINISNLNPGIYLLKIEHAKIVRFVKE